MGIISNATKAAMSVSLPEPRRQNRRLLPRGDIWSLDDPATESVNWDAQPISWDSQPKTATLGVVRLTAGIWAGVVVGRLAAFLLTAR
jgi:hypothetical protein